MDKFDRLITNWLIDYIEKLNSSNRDQIIAMLRSDSFDIKYTAIRLFIKRITTSLHQILIDLHNQHLLVTIDYYFAGHGLSSALVDINRPIQASQRQKWTILRTYLQGLIWQQELLASSDNSIDVMTKKYRKTARYMLNLINFSFMAPELVERVLARNIPPNVTSKSLIFNWPMDWTEQRKRFDP